MGGVVELGRFRLSVFVIEVIVLVVYMLLYVFLFGVIVYLMCLRFFLFMSLVW